MNSYRERDLDYCLKCSTCHTQCPVVANYLPFPGPKKLGPELERLRIAGNNDIMEIAEEYIDYCTNCKRCDIACPHGVKPAYYNLINKENVRKNKQQQLRDWVLAHNGWWSKIAGQMPGLANFLLKNPLVKFFMGILGIAKRDFPQYKKLRVTKSQTGTNGKVVYYPGCYARYNEPEIMQATIDILEAYGFLVEIPEIECCGTPIISNGLLGEAKSLIEKNIKIFASYVEEGLPIVVTCPSCGLTLKEEYLELSAQQLNNNFPPSIWDLFEFLAMQDKQPFALNKGKYQKAFYHAPCHLMAQGIGLPAVNFLRNFAVKDLVVEDYYCCGISGTYGFKKEKYSLANSIGSPLFKAVEETGTELVLTECGTCKLQIEHNTTRNVKHPVLLLREYLYK